MGHDCALQTQAPPTQALPAPHAAWLPHWHWPVTAQLSAWLGSQVTQAAPPSPQVVLDGAAQVDPEQQPPGQFVVLQSLQTPPPQMRPAQSWQRAPPLPQLLLLVPARQVAPEQHPLGQEVRSQTHAPLTQRWPPAHGAPVPHWQVPVVEHRSAPAPQLTQALPVTPQVAAAAVLQTVPAQQPAPHDSASQMQVPPAQRCAAPHSAAPPQVQAPVAEQASARVVSQPTHTAPPLPQVGSDGALQVAPEQQPPGQLVALQPLQCPPVQVWPAGQVVQAPPPPPHEATLSPARQAPAAQQPVGHEVLSQTQVLATQRWPAAQVVPVPQRQLPVAEQLSEWASHATQVEPALPQVVMVRFEQMAPLQHPLGHEVASQMHRPSAQRCPPAHAGPDPQAQVPSVPQWSALLVSQATQAAPFAPQVASARVLQTAPAQHPPAHEVASQVQAPPTQCWPSVQGAPLPQRHVPASEQVSALVGSQARQAPALLPQVVSERG